MAPAGPPQDEARPGPSPVPGVGLEGARTTAEERQAILAAFSEDEPAEGLGMLSALEGAFPEGGANIPSLSRFLLDGEAPSGDFSLDDDPGPAMPPARGPSIPEPDLAVDAQPEPLPETPSLLPDPEPPAPSQLLDDDEPDLLTAALAAGEDEPDLSGIYAALGNALDTLGVEDGHPIREGMPEPVVMRAEELEPWSDEDLAAAAITLPERDPSDSWPTLPVGRGRIADDLWLCPGSDTRLRILMPASLRRHLDPRPPSGVRLGLLMGRMVVARDPDGRQHIDVTVGAAVPLEADLDSAANLIAEARQLLDGLLRSGAQEPGTAWVPVGTYHIRTDGGLTRLDKGLHEALMPHGWQICLLFDEQRSEACLLTRVLGRMPRKPSKGSPIFDPATGGLIRGSREAGPAQWLARVPDMLAPTDVRAGLVIGLGGLVAAAWMARPETFALSLVDEPPGLRWSATDGRMALYACMGPDFRADARRRLKVLAADLGRMDLPRAVLPPDHPSTRIWYRLARLDQDGLPHEWSRAVPYTWRADRPFAAPLVEMHLSLNSETISVGLRRPDPSLSGLWILREGPLPGKDTELLTGRRHDGRVSLQDHVDEEGIYRYLVLPQDRMGLLGRPWDTAAVGMRRRPPWDAWGN